MHFGPTPIEEALGTILGHTLRLGSASVVKKGTRLGPKEVDALRTAGILTVVAARLTPDDVHEDEAATLVAKGISGPGIALADASTGRCNLHASVDGLLRIDRAACDRLNLIDEAVTLATIAPMTPVRAGDLVATVKIIPFAAPRAVIDACVSVGESRAVSVTEFRQWNAGLILTRLPGTKESVLDRAAGTQRARADRLGGTIAREVRCDHSISAVSTALSDLLNEGLSPILLLGASAIVDRRDVIPSAVEAAGGTVVHLGMPVDPGNLLMLARRGNVHIIGVPGCARSLDRSGFDMVLERIAARLPVTRADLMTMGTGGLLIETPARPFPRAGDAPTERHEPAIAAVILAAGRGSRMTDQNKLLAEVDGLPLVLHAVNTFLATDVRPVVVVTGHDGEAVRSALTGKNVICVHNARWAEGMSTSLAAGVAELGEDIDGAFIALGDMPRIRPAHVEALRGAFDPRYGRAICAPTWQRRRGNPVLFSRHFFAEMRLIEGDRGARHLLEKHAALVCNVPMPDGGVTIDVDTPEALTSLRTSPAKPDSTQ
ncbi:MAG: molybdopterin-binding/glycosyltransferase family 2 protein [Polyangiaceae bacterium]|nr:molybdopterin-binding/glycosyltransferase family 2 protein [Polyangiaceae bacterium]